MEGWEYPSRRGEGELHCFLLVRGGEKISIRNGRCISFQREGRRKDSVSDRGEDSYFRREKSREFRKKRMYGVVCLEEKGAVCHKGKKRGGLGQVGPPHGKERAFR